MTVLVSSRPHYVFFFPSSLLTYLHLHLQNGKLPCVAGEPRRLSGRGNGACRTFNLPVESYRELSPNVFLEGLFRPLGGPFKLSAS